MALVTKTFSDIITFTRTGTSATYFNSAGVLTTAGANVPRFDYNPATLAAQGLLIEEARTNSILQSQTFQTTWTATRSSVSANTAVAPDGTTTADSIVEDGTAANTHDLRQGGVSNSATTNWTLSFFLKAVNRTWALIELQNATATSNRARAWFNLQTGVVGTGNAAGSGITYVSHSIQNIGNGWYRCVVVGTVDVSVTSIQAWLEGTTADNTANYNGVNGQTSIYVWGAQLEAGAFPTSYIPTTVIAATRSADVASVNTLSPWFNASAGTLFAEYIATNSAQNNSAASLSDNTNDNRMLIRATNSSAQTVFIGVASTVTQWNDIIATALLNTPTKSAFGYATNDIAWVRNGGTVGTDTTATIPTVNRLQLGLDGAGTLPLNGYLRRITYYPRRLSNAELVSITS